MGAVDRALAAGKLERLQERQIEAIVSDWWRRREIAREPVPESPDEIDGLVAAAEDDTHQSCAGLSDEAVRSTADRLLVEAGMPGRPHRVGKLTTSLLYPVVDRNTHSYRYLCELVSRGLVAETALTRDRLLSNHETPFDPLFNPNGARKAEAGGSGYRLSDLFRDYAAERATRYGRHSTEKRYGFVFRIMDEVLGRDRLMSSLTRADLVSVLAFVQRLPPNPTKRFPTLTLTEIVEKADAEALPRLAPNSVSTYMQALAAALRWAKDAGWEVNVASRDLVGSRRAMIKRRGFRPDELSALFATLIAYRTLEPAKFWVPALALYTGARAGELCQLRVEDVIDVDGIKCLNLSSFDGAGRRVEDKRLKTKASERFVPLHPELIKAGFDAFVQEQSEGRLFPALKIGPDGTYSHDFSKWFGRHKRKIGFDEPSLVLHSFRHGFRDACRRAEISEETAQALGGWASASQAARYGDRGLIPVLDRAVRKLEFGDFVIPRAA